MSQNVTRLPTGTLHATHNAAFVAFYTQPFHLYRTHDHCKEWGEKVLNTKLSLLSVLMRWDGSLGFIGGSVDEGETLVQAAIREVREEVNFNITPDMFELFSSHDCDGKLAAHLFVCELTPDQIYDLQLQSVSSSHGRVESSGMNVVHMVEESFTNLMKPTWAGSGKQELALLFASGIIKQPEVVTDV